MNLEHIRGDKVLIGRYILSTMGYIIKTSKNNVKCKDIKLTSNVRSAVNKISAKIADGGESTSIVLCGGTGVGKTLIMEASVRVFSSMYTNIERLMADDMIACVSNIEGYPQSGAHLSTGLYIDDVGRESERYIEFGQEVKPFEKIIYQRYESQLEVLFITTNLLPDKILARYGDRVMSRLAESSAFIEIKGEDFRYE